MRCSPHHALHRGWWIAPTVIVLIAVLALQNYIRMICTIGYGISYWLHPSAVYVAEGMGKEDVLPVPKLLHQTWKDVHVPEKWQAAQKSCIDAHPEYVYKLWTDQDGLNFLQQEYPWFLNTYLSYPHSIQRVDALRYFILHTYGGIYLDLDVGCKRRLDFMRRANFTAPITSPVGMSNDVMAAVPRSPFLEQVIKRLPYWNHWLLTKYIQVMFSTGPMFLTNQYALAPAHVKASVAFIPPELYVGDGAALYHLVGGSWHADDAAFIFWIDQHKHQIILIVCLALVVGTVGLILGRRRFVGAGSLSGHGCVVMPAHQRALYHAHKQTDSVKTV